MNATCASMYPPPWRVEYFEQLIDGHPPRGTRIVASNGQIVAVNEPIINIGFAVQLAPQFVLMPDLINAVDTAMKAFAIIAENVDLNGEALRTFATEQRSILYSLVERTKI